MEDIEANVSRIGSDVLPRHPDLVIWQLGTNDVVWRGLSANAKEHVVSAVRRMKAAHADVVLMDLQYAPLVTMSSRHQNLQKIITAVAREERVGHFQRFTLMKRASDAGVGGLVSWDGLHNTSDGYDCIGRALAQMIDAAAR
jgi:lysophospholipase L1-like esterase